MQTEIEAKFLYINHDKMRKQLTSAGAVLMKPKRLMKRSILDYPDKHLQKQQDSWLRVRDEGDIVTMTYKQTTEHEFGGAQEIEIEVSDYEKTVELLVKMGLEVQAFQESTRETWKLGQVEVVLDEWPWLDPFIEIEGPTRTLVRSAASILNLQWKDAVFGSVTTIYRLQYPAITKDRHISELPKITFNTTKPEWFGKGKTSETN